MAAGLHGSARLGRHNAASSSGAPNVASADLRLGGRVLVTGSPANGRFHEDLDVDFLVTGCPRRLVRTFGDDVEDQVGGLPFDVVSLDEVPLQGLRDSLLGEGVRCPRSALTPGMGSGAS